MRATSITLVPLGGLCNRMRAMASSVMIAQRKGCPIVVRWEKNRDCFANFLELFEPVCIDGLSVSLTGQVDYWHKVARKWNIYLPRILRWYFFQHQLDDHTSLDDRTIETLHGSIFIISAGVLADCYPLKALFVPTSEIQETIDSLTSHFSEHVVGMHIRRTDNVKSIQQNDVDDFLRCMDKRLHDSPNVMFYVATDDRAVKQTMINRYGDRIIFHPAKLERTSLQGMKDAVVDLWCLSQTKEIIGSYHSSYSEIAAQLGGAKLTILRRNATT